MRDIQYNGDVPSPEGGASDRLPDRLPDCLPDCLQSASASASALAFPLYRKEGVDMPTRGGNAFRPSRVSPDLRIANNLPGCYPVEDWRTYYWAVADDGAPCDRYVTVQLPRGCADACSPVEWGEPGCVYHVRRWGLACRPSLLETIGFDPTSVVGPDARPSAHVRLYLEVTHFDLPGGFIIADPDYPLLLFDPAGDLKGSCIDGISYLGALAWMVTQGRIAADFQRMRQEAPMFYHVAVEEFSRALREGTRSP